MAYGNKYYLDFYDRFSNQLKVYILQEDYTGAVIDVIGGGISIHWLGEGDSKYSVVKGSTCEFNIVSETDQAYLSMFTGTSRDYMIKVFNGSDELWRGYVDPDSYKEPFLQPPYVSTIHASDGLGTLRNIKFPKPDSTKYYTFEQPIIYFIAELLKQTGHELDIYVANTISFTGASPGRGFDSIHVSHKTFRDKDNEFESCYDILVKILTSLGSRIHQYGGAWHIERIDYKREDSYTYFKYDCDGTFIDSRVSDWRLTMTGASGSPLCVWTDQSQDLEIVPAWKEFDIDYKPGENRNIIKFTNPNGVFIDDEFQLPPGGVGPLGPRYFTKYSGSVTYGNLNMMKFHGTEYWRFNGVSYGHQTLKDIWSRVISDTVTLDNNSILEDGSLKFKIEFKAQIDSDNPHLFHYRPFLRYNIQMKFPNSAWEGSMPYGYIKSSPGNTLTIYFMQNYLGQSKLRITSVTDWVYGLNDDDYFVCGFQSFLFNGLKEEHEFSIETEPIMFEDGYNEQPTIQLMIYPLATTYYLDDPHVPTYPTSTYGYVMDVYYARVQIVNQEGFYSKTDTIDMLNENRLKPSNPIYWFMGGGCDHNPQFFNRYVFLKSTGLPIGDTWTVGGILRGALITGVLLPEYLSQYNRPTRKITGEILSEDIHFGSVLIDNFGKKYICTGVEWDLKNSRWNGEWIQIYDPNTVDAGDYDADDFDASDFWAI